MIRRRSFDRRLTLGRRIVRDRRRVQNLRAVERRSGKERRSGIARRSGQERRSRWQDPVRSAAHAGRSRSLADPFPPFGCFEHTQPRILPRDGKQPVAAGAHQPERVLAERRPRAAARAHPISRSPACRRMLGASEPRHDGPRGGTKREDLKEAARHGHRLSVHFEDAFERGRADHAVPRAAPYVTAGADSRASPLFCVRHGRPPGRRGDWRFGYLGGRESQFAGL